MFCNNLKDYCVPYNLDKGQIYNADETGLYYRGLPNKTYVGPNEKSAPDIKIDKNHLTILFCLNATGVW